ncbi:hypothetical protein [Rufibacter sp. LB8]|uniref:hypothetical protein n=1 Tax=Rufibacter sp. LB8 TaxID=2777781 RepID=UPI00178C6340|nr:hypothetical protein [Rufibacter sp. LB8]
MKNLFPFFAAFFLLTGSACSTYTANTDPNDLGSGSELQEEVTTTTPEAPATTEAAPAAANADSAAAPVKEEAAAPAAH